MRIKKQALNLVLAAILPLGVAAQSSSINTFSPYTMYGIGDVNTPGTSYIRSMGGAGVAYANPYKMNYLNPAAAGTINQRYFILNFGMEGDNYYLKDQNTSSSYNTFNISGFGVQFPLSRRLNATVNVTPFSSVGYRITKTDDDPTILTDLKRVRYDYSGEGGMTQFKAGLGYALSKRLSLGAEMIYYLGNIDRSFDTYVTTYGTETENSIYAYETNRISRFYLNTGFIYNAVMTRKHLLAIGGTYQPGGRLSPKTVRDIPSGNLYGDTVAYSSQLSEFRMPDIISAGLAWHTAKASVMADYTFEGWGSNDKSDLNRSNIRYRNTNSFKVGGEYTPERLDVRHFMNRLTYRAGFRYSDYYININGQDISEKAFTFGVGIPFRQAGVSAVNVGFEIGQRGTVKAGLVKENFFKMTVGLSLFGEDYWFVKPKYD